jgi:hypothetical protein
MNDAFYNQDHSTQAAIHQQEREYNKRLELLNKAVEGMKRYNFDPLFRRVIDAMVGGADSWEIIERLLEMNTELSRKIKILLEKWPNRDWPNLDK